MFEKHDMNSCFAAMSDSWTNCSFESDLYLVNRLHKQSEQFVHEIDWTIQSNSESTRIVSFNLERDRTLPRKT